MTNQIQHRSAAAGLSTTDAARIRKALDQARADATRRSYAGHWARWTAWAAGRSIDPKPADPAVVAAWLTERAAAGAGMATIKVMRSALSAFHLEAGLPDPTASAGVKRVMAGLSRMYNKPQRQARGLTRECLAAIQATAHFPRALPSGRLENAVHAAARARLDVALVAVMRDGMLRRSEAAAITWGDVERASDGSGRLTVRRSKTDQTGEGSVQYLSQEAMKALAGIRPASPRLETRVFGLSDRQICRRIRAAAEAAGLEGEFVGHSPRVGMAMDLAATGCELPALMTAGRWTSSSMPARYTRSETAARGAVARYYGMGAD